MHDTPRPSLQQWTLQRQKGFPTPSRCRMVIDWCQLPGTDHIPIADFSRMRSEGFRFTLRVWGLRVCSLDVAFTVATVRNRPQPSATVRNRPQPFATVRNRLQPSARSPYGRAFGKFCRRGHFWRFPTFRCFVSRGRRGTLWQSDVFCNVSKVVLCGRCNTQAIL